MTTANDLREPPKNSLISNVTNAMSKFDRTYQQVFIWRKDEFVRLGFTDAWAAHMAATTADLEIARKLHSQKCPNYLIVDILGGEAVPFLIEESKVAETAKKEKEKVCDQPSQ